MVFKRIFGTKRKEVNGDGKNCAVDSLVTFTPPKIFFFLFFGPTAPQWVMASSFTTCLNHTHRRTTVGRTLLDE